MEYPGLLNWANSIRLTMSNDSGRQLFKDQVQTHGFSFLDDYLDNIISGGKQDPLIELVKTPGRKKAIARKPKLLSKLAVVTLSLDEEEEDNTPQTSEAREPKSKSAPLIPTPLPEEEKPKQATHTLNGTLTAPKVDHNDLSIIAEDDEPSERSLNSPSKPQRNSIPRAAPVPKSSPKDDIKSKVLPPQADMDVDELLASPKPASPIVRSTERDSSHSKQDPLLEEDDLFEPQDIVMDNAQDFTVQLDAKASEKPATTYFPFLPDPAPLRKSIKIGAATPGAPLGGKRTSWLKKGRDLKALEMTTQKPHSSATNLAAPQLLPSQGTKRRSEDATQSSVPEREEPRQSKVPKNSKGDSPSGNLADHAKTVEDRRTTAHTPINDHMDVEEEESPSGQEGVLDRLKKTVEGLGTRSSKSQMTKSLGGDAATALAEARAAAELRVAERDRIEEEHTMALQKPFSVLNAAHLPKAKAQEPEVSDLFPADGRIKEKGKAPERPFQFTRKDTSLPVSAEDIKRSSTSTTPPHSPPPQPASSFSLQPQPQPPAPVFHNPTPVFVPPVSLPINEPKVAPVFSFQPQPKPSPIFSAPTNHFAAALNSFSQKYTAPPLTTHSTIESVQSDRIFDDDTIPTWLPSTQDTEYTQTQPQTQICDEDDSWPVDEKLAAGVQWTFGGKEDSMTWSTLPSQSQRGDTATSSSKLKAFAASEAADVAMEEEPEEDLINRDHELEEIVLGSSKSNVSEPPRSQSQMSFASSESSQSQAGFFGQASKLLSNALGTAKKKQPEVKKVLQKAAEAAKKQQEEADKKAARLKEMESRRQLALQRKAEEEKAKALEEERKMKEEVERRKREREDLTDKRALKATTSKKEEDFKTRKVDADKKPELKKPSSSVFGAKVPLKTAMKQPSSSNNAQTPNYSKIAGDTVTNTLKNKMNASSSKAQQYDDEIVHPSQALQMQMAARAKAQLDASKPQIASESIELPDVNSEYSDSDDEDRKRTFDPPDWAQSPELRTALEQQSTINPDDIFGAVRPLKMEELFKNRTGRFRARTSSANWTGTDRLTAQEEAEYARRMGFK